MTTLRHPKPPFGSNKIVVGLTGQFVIAEIIGSLAIPLKADDSGAQRFWIGSLAPVLHFPTSKSPGTLVIWWLRLSREQA